MNCDVVNNFINELQRCELSDFDDSLSVENHTYNNVKGSQGSDYYSLYLGQLYNSVVDEIRHMMLDLNNYMPYLTSLYKDIFEISELYFDVPTKEAVNALQKDYDLSKKNDIKVKNELARMKFFREMRAVQMYYFDKIKTHIEAIIMPVTDKTQAAMNNDFIKDFFRSYLNFIKEGNSISGDNFKERVDFSLMSLTADGDFSKTKKDISLALAEGLESITRIIRTPYSDEAVEVRSVLPNVAEKKIITLTEAIEHYGVPKKAKDRKWRDDCKFPTLQNEKGCSVRIDVEELKEWQKGRK